MEIINPKFEPLKTIIRPVDDSIIMGLTKIAFKCNKDTELFDIRDKLLYTSKYKPNKLEQKELELENFLKSLQHLNIITSNQNKEYKWVQINSEKLDSISTRFYIAPNPYNMHELVKKLVQAFYTQKISVDFKYQLTTGMEQCDRIIIYSDENNKGKIEKALKNVYQNYPSLFSGCERSIAWLYDTSIPGVYIAPETSGYAYSIRLSEVIIDAKNTFNFLYGIKSNTKLTLNGKEAEKAIEYMKLLITSLMLRKGILLSKDGRCITIKDKDIKSHYNAKTGVLILSNNDERGYYEAKFFPTLDGRKALLENFYSVSKIQSHPGLETRYLTPAQRDKETYRNLYPDSYQAKYSQPNTGNNSSFSKPKF